MIVLFSVLAAASVAAIVSTIVVTARDGYGAQKTRSYTSVI